MEKGSPDVPTPVSDGERLYMFDDQGSMTCVNARTGARIYGPESTGIGRTSGSPTLADGKIYVPNQGGDVFVLRAAPKFELLATNSVNESTNASLATSDDQLFLRTDNSLWCFGSASQK